VSKTNINEDIIESLIGKTAEKKRSKIPARLDVLQSATGLFLAIFMVFHMLFVSTILVSKDFMLSVTKAFELSLGEVLFLSSLLSRWSLLFLSFMLF